MDDETHDEVLKRATLLLAQYDQSPETVYVLKPGEQPAVLKGDYCLTDGRKHVNVHTNDILFSNASFCVYLRLLEENRLLQVSVRPGFKAKLFVAALKVAQAVLSSSETADKLVATLENSQEVRERLVVKTYLVENKLRCVKCGQYIKSGRVAVVLFLCDLNIVTPSDDDCVGCFHQECYLAMMNDDESLPDYRITMH